MRSDSDLLESRFHHFYTQDITAQPCSWSRCPAVAQAVTESLVTVITIRTMYINLSFRHQFIDAGSILRPINVEVFPESSSSQIEHGSPILTDDVHGSLIVACLCHSFQHIVTIESREALRSTYTQYFLVGLFGFHQSCQCHKSSTLLGLVMIRDILLQLLGSLGTTVSQFLVAHRQCHLMTGIHCHDHQRLQTGIHTLHIR